MSQSIKDEVIGLLTNHRELTSAERAEIDTLGVALSLRDNDPSWGQVIWAWAVMPRQEKFDISQRALAAEIRSDMQVLLNSARGEEANSIGGEPVRDERLDELKALIQAIADRPAASVAANVDPKMIHAAMLSALEKQKGVVSSAEMLSVIKASATEIFSWMNAALAAIILGICLFVGFQFGEHVQAGSDDAAMQKMEKQISDLTAALPKR